MISLEKIRRFASLPFYDQLNSAALAAERVKGVLLYRRIFKAFGKGSAICAPLLIAHPGYIEIGERVTIRNGARLEVVLSRPGRQPVLRIGDGVFIEQRVHIACHSSIIIGANVCIAGHCAILDVSHPLTNRSPTTNVVSKIVDDDRPVRIGDGAFIGFGTVILPGVTIGECAVIGANSVVTRDIPAYCTAAGAPAVVLRKGP